jgi:hypothetical protein
MVETARPEMSIKYGAAFSCWIAKVTNTHPEYAIVTAFPLSYMNALNIAFGRTLLVLSSVLGFIFKLMSIESLT